MKLLILLLLFVTAYSLEFGFFESYAKRFGEYKLRFGKEYKDEAENLRRLNIFVNNTMEIARINSLYSAGEISWWAGENQFTDLTTQEFERDIVGKDCVDGFTEMKKTRFQKKEIVPSDMKPLDSVDWRDQGAVTPVKNQGQCGSCWSFSSTGAMEGANKIFGDGQLESLSEQQLVDCAGSFGNQGCNGGLMDNAFQYFVTNKAMLESDYPYEGTDGNTCSYVSTKGLFYGGGFTDVTTECGSCFKNALGQRPVSVAVDASGNGWQMYNGGVISNKQGIFGAGCNHNSLDHGVLAVAYGYDADHDKDYWTIKNSWGSGWGENGYIRLENKNSNDGGTCLVQECPSYPKLANTLKL